MKIISKDYDDIKAGCCNNGTSTLYAFEGQDVDELGMCARCFVDWLIEVKAEVMADAKFLG